MAPPERSPDPGRRVRRAYLTATALIAALGVSAFTATERQLKIERQATHAVNTAGRQRSLSQQVALQTYTAHVARGDDRARALDALERARERWLRTQHGLLDGDPEERLEPADDPTLRAALLAASDAFATLDASARRAARGDAEALGALNAHSADCLERLEAVVSLYEQASFRQVRRLQSLQAALLCALIGVLAFVAWRVFEPAVRLLRQQFLALARRDEASRRALAVLAESEALREANRTQQLELDTIREANRLKTNFLATVSHELRTPLHSVLSYCDLIEAHGSLDERGTTYLTRLRGAGQRLLHLVEDLLSLSQLDAGRSPSPPSHVDLLPLLDDLQVALEPARSQHVRLRVTCPEDASVTTDPHTLSRILGQLLGNALKFTATGEAHVDVVPGPSATEIRVHDTGPGIPPSHQPQIFDMYRQSGGTARAQGGSGLGLAITSRLVRQIGATLDLRSAPGHGSTFTLSLPATLPPQDYTHLTFSRPPDTTDPPTTLWVVARDPHHDAWDLLLREVPLKCVHRAPEPAAVDRLLVEAPRAVVVDATDDPVSGLAFLCAIRELDPPSARPPVLFVSGADDLLSGPAALDFGAHTELRKPLAPEALRRELELLLGGVHSAGVRELRGGGRQGV